MKKLIKRLLNDNSGNFAIMFGLALTPIMAATAAAVDYSGFKRMETRMTISADAAMLAASKHITFLRDNDIAENGYSTLTNEELIAKFDEVFRPHFEANFEAGGYTLNPDDYEISINEVDNIATIDISMKYFPAIAPVIGIDEMNSNKVMTTNFKVQPKNYVIDIVMCIDATGSMQDTLDGVLASAETFNADLRTELGIGTSSQMIKIRMRPIFFRDWEEGRDYQTDLTKHQSFLSDWEEYQDEMQDEGFFDYSLTEAEKQAERDEWNDSPRITRWNGSLYWSDTGPIRRFILDGKWYFAYNMAEVEYILEHYRRRGPEQSGEMPPSPPKPVAPPTNHGLTMHPDFIDMDPSLVQAAGTPLPELRAARIQELETFLGSTVAYGGHDWPEAAGACLNEAIRSNWFDNQSAESRNYFNIPATSGGLPHKIIAQGDPVPEEDHTLVTPISVVVFWSDATINTLELSNTWLSDTTPLSWSAFENHWNDPDMINQDRKIFVRFGPEDAAGYNTIMDWNQTEYGGSLSEGNTNAVKGIAAAIREALPDVLRLGS